MAFSPETGLDQITITLERIKSILPKIDQTIKFAKTPDDLLVLHQSRTKTLPGVIEKLSLALQKPNSFQEIEEAHKKGILSNPLMERLTKALFDYRRELVSPWMDLKVQKEVVLPATNGHVKQPEVFKEAEVVIPTAPVALNGNGVAQESLNGVTEIKELPHTKETEALFIQLFEKYQKPIYNHVYRTIGDPEDAKEMTQDAFIKAYRKLPEAIARGNFQAQAWLYRIATNVCLDELKHRQLLKWTPWETFTSTFHPTQIARDNPEKDLLNTELRGQVWAVLESLSPRYRAALVLREFDGLGYEAIAKQLGTSRLAVKTLLVRARESFRLHFNKKFPGLVAESKGAFTLPRALGRSASAGNNQIKGR